MSAGSGGASVMWGFGHARFLSLSVSQARPPALLVNGLVAVQKLTSGPSKWALDVKAYEGIDVNSADCREVAECSFKVNEKWLTNFRQFLT